MSVTLRAAAIASRLLESDMEFHNILQRPNLTLYSGTSKVPEAEPRGQLEIWWTIEIDARNWGVKDIVPSVQKLVLDGWYIAPTEDGGDADTGETFHYEYPADDRDPAAKAIGTDVDAPTPANVLRMARPKWKVSWKIDQYRSEGSVRTSFVPEATVYLNSHTIEITF